ncbi:MAG: ribosome silencing factor [Deltaproteobacteria bacterium]|nr:ribosome silencing factor [Deltaproteobacteria bacterium]MBW2219469.1 ribosome silencing factor [Deltaproteobacteria bacterium]
MTFNPDLSKDYGIEIFFKAVFGRKAENPVVLDVRELTSVADFFIILSGRSNRHARSIGEFIREDLKKQGKVPLSVEGMKDGQWVLLDFGHVIIHIFYEPVRSFYDLEGLWTDAKRVGIDQYLNSKSEGQKDVGMK